MSSPFFHKRSSHALPYVTIARVNPGSPINMVLCTAQPQGYSVHWVQRAILCPGDECPACRTNARRDVFSFVGFHGSDRKLIELGHATVDSMRSQIAENGLHSFEGTCWSFTKDKRKSTIQARFYK